MDGAVAAAAAMMQDHAEVTEEESALFKELYELKHPAAAVAATPAGASPEDGQLEWSLRQAFVAGAAAPSGLGPHPDEVVQ